MGMGGAAIAVVNDETSLLLNPIGLGRLREPYITLFDPEITTNLDGVHATQNLGGTGAAEIDQVYDELANKLDKRYFTRAQIFPSFATRDYGFGLLGKYDMTATRDSTTGIMAVDYVSDWAGVLGVNHSFSGGILKIGAIGKLIDRIQYTGNVDPATQPSIKTKDLVNEGVGLGVDVGFSLTSPTDYLPTIAVMAKDVGGTSFGYGSGMRGYNSNIDPKALPMTVDVALAIFPINSQYLRSTFTVEYDDLTGNLTYWGTKQKLHGGVEINLVDQLFFRAGYNRGYLTGGLEWAIRNIQIQLAYYGEEVGTETTPVKDERVAVKIAIRF